jgi:vacuolar-type H+-ATPase subunit F/Vma7
MNIVVIADPQTCLAFALAGIETHPVDSATEVLPILASLRPQETGLVLVSEPLADANREVVERLILEPGGLLLLEIPAMAGPLKKRSGVTERLVSLLRR